MEMLGFGDGFTKPPCAIRNMPATANPSGTAIAPMMMKAGMTQPIQLRDVRCGAIQGDGLSKLGGGGGKAEAGGAAHFPGGGLTSASDARAVSASGFSSSRMRASGSSSDFIHRCSHTKIGANSPMGSVVFASCPS